MEGCGKVFFVYGILILYMKIYSGEKFYLCFVIGCEKRFIKVFKLKLYLRLYIGERFFYCEVEVLYVYYIMINILCCILI